jgi:hypothetical protein
MKRDLPGPELRCLIHPHTGDVTDIRPTERGFSSDFTVLVECEKGPFFVKAMRNRPGRRRDSIIRERLINPFVWPISPALQWHAEDDEWIVLGFEVVDGRRANVEPDSPDLPAIVGLLNRIGRLELPEVAHDWPETRWDRFTTDKAEADLLQGDALLHTDINPSNLLLGSQEDWVVDWSWPTRGAAFIDPACLVVQLVSAGHSPKVAESWAARCKAWANADPKAIDTFAAAYTRMLWTSAWRQPEESWLKAMAEATEAWANHRGLTVT